MLKLRTMKCRILIPILFVLLMPWPASVQAQDVAGDLLGRINSLRTSQGLHAYSLNGALTAAAQNHASWMAETGQVSHTQPDGSTPSIRATRAGYSSTWVSENIYMGTNASAGTAWQWWLNSPIHYRGIVSANNRDIGIAAATGPAGTAFVLVFGNPGGAAAAPPVRVSGGSQAAASGPPPYVVGVDNLGNIMHEIQPDHTLGHIVFMYGYGWDDLQRIRDLNELTEEEGRNLSIGGILLIPPAGGTYTPTPVSDEDATATAAAPQATEALAEGDRSDMGIIAAVTEPPPTATQTATPAAIGTSAVVPEWIVETMIAAQESGEFSDFEAEDDAALLAASAGIISTPELSSGEANDETDETIEDGVPWRAATVTPSGEAVAMANVDDDSGDDGQPIAATASIIPGAGNTSPWLIAAVFLQVIILIVAAAEFFRRSRQS